MRKMVSVGALRPWKSGGMMCVERILHKYYPETSSSGLTVSCGVLSECSTQFYHVMNVWISQPHSFFVLQEILRWGATTYPKLL